MDFGTLIKDAWGTTWRNRYLWGLALFYRFPPHGADGLRELAGVLNSEVREGDGVFATPPTLMPTLAQYYGGEVRGVPEDFRLTAVYLPYSRAEWQARAIERLEAQAPGHERVWLVYRSEQDPEGRLLQTLERRYLPVERRAYRYADLYLYVAR